MFFARFIVEGNSMAPVFLHGERLLVNKLNYLMRSPRAGEVVILRHPQERNRMLLKRIAQVHDKETLSVISEDLENGTDSRSFGPVKKKDIIGRALFRY